MFKCSYKITLLLLLVSLFSGCATVSYVAGFNPFFGKPAQPTRQAKAYAMYLTAVVYERRGEIDKAIESWQQVLAYDEEALTPRLRIIGAYLRLGDNDKAMEMCRQALEFFPEQSELWIVLGELDHRRGNIEAAIDAFSKAIELKPDDLTGYSALVELRENTNDLVAAIDIYERLIKKSPNSAALYYQLGINLAQINDTAYAQRTFQKVLEMEPRITRARFFLALTYFESGDYERCAEELRLYLLERPYDTTALEYRAAALARMGILDEARYAMELILAGKDAQNKNSLQHAWLLLESDQVEKAQQFALESGAYFFADLIFTWNILATASPEEESTDVPWDERFSLDDVETECDQFISAVMNLFGTDYVGDKTLQMIEVISDSVVFSPALSLFQARILLAMDKYQDAVAVLELILSNGISSKYAHYHCAIAYEELKNLEKTEEHLLKYLEIDPEDADVLNFLGYFYADNNKNLDEAETLLNRALKKDPENPFYLDSLGWLYFRKGRLEEAAALVRRAIYTMETDDALLRDHLGDIYLKQGDTKHALAEWLRALRLDPSLQTVRDKIEHYTPSKD